MAIITGGIGDQDNSFGTAEIKQSISKKKNKK